MVTTYLSNITPKTLQWGVGYGDFYKHISRQEMFSQLSNKIFFDYRGFLNFMK